MSEPAPLPAPTPDQDSRPYWDGLAEGELRIQRCRECRRFQHFPAPICSSCWSFDLGFEAVSGRGTIETFVVIEHTAGPTFAARAPITAAWVELPEQAGLRVLADVIGDRLPAAAIQVGTPVELVLDRNAWAPTAERPDPPPLPRFRPITDADPIADTQE